MEVKLLLNGLYIARANSYGVVSNDAAVVIDCGKYDLALENFLEYNKDKARLILLTHAHFDHILGVQKLREKTGVPIAIGKTEAENMCNPEYNLSNRLREKIGEFKPDYTIVDEQTVTVGSLKIKAYEMPGHTKGSMVYLIGNNLFSGDVLFKGSVGRTDLPGGNSDEMRNSLDRIMWLFGDDINVYPGHDAATTMGDERKNNPYLR
ncbi:MAG: MBL fold metallo-hydrolase [Clostridia bacterium]|nr:MBL fold metallo-hydrolase [Clostridia bacterium]